MISDLEVVRLYVHEYQSASALALRFETSSKRITDILKSQGVTLRTASEAAKLRAYIKVEGMIAPYKPTGIEVDFRKLTKPVPHGHTIWVGRGELWRHRVVRAWMWYFMRGYFPCRGSRAVTCCTNENCIIHLKLVINTRYGEREVSEAY